MPEELLHLRAGNAVAVVLNDNRRKRVEVVALAKDADLVRVGVEGVPNELGESLQRLGARDLLNEVRLDLDLELVHLLHCSSLASSAPHPAGVAQGTSHALSL